MEAQWSPNRNSTFRASLAKENLTSEQFATLLMAVTDYFSVRLQPTIQGHLTKLANRQDPDLKDPAEFIQIVLKLHKETHRKVDPDSASAKEIIALLSRDNITDEKSLLVRLERARFSSSKEIEVATLHVNRALRAATSLEFQGNKARFKSETNSGELESLMICLQMPDVFYSSKDPDTRQCMLPSELQTLRKSFLMIDSDYACMDLKIYPSEASWQLARSTRDALLLFEKNPNSEVQVSESGLNALAHARPEKLAIVFDRIYARILAELKTALEEGKFTRADLQGAKIYSVLEQVAPRFYALMRSCGLIPWVNRKAVANVKGYYGQRIYGLAPEAKVYTDALPRALALLNVLIQVDHGDCHYKLFLKDKVEAGTLTYNPEVPIEVIRSVGPAAEDVRALLQD